VKARETAELGVLRWQKLELLQKHYQEFVPFLVDVMNYLGFDTSTLQRDIAGYIAYGPKYLMVQAQRGQAKTTITAIYAIWHLIHNPDHRVLILSAGSTMANEISTLIVRLIMTLPILECMRPDKLAGDKTSLDAFDVHHTIKGLNKSPSVSCIGIEGQLQGKRADVIIADDVESQKNSATAVQRAKLLHLTKDFTSINSTGRILWLGTPQTSDSIYNSLAGRGVAIRVWPGRYPTPEQRAHYADTLAPLIAGRLDRQPELGTGGGFLGDQGQPTDPTLLDEGTLQAKERDQGTPYFQLQHMLMTALTDALRYPLKPALLVGLATDGINFPMTVVRGMGSGMQRDYSSCGFAFTMAEPHDLSRETRRLQSKWAYIDPAPGGANGDETAYAIGGFLNSNIYLLSAGGVPGGYELFKLEELAKRLAKFDLDGVTIERNMGYGAFRAVFLPILRKYMQCEVTDDLVTGQKEVRILNTLAPIMGRGSLIVSQAVVEEDQSCCQVHPPALQQSYSLFFQLAKLSAQRDALLHDDRADALEGLCRHYTAALAIDQKKVIEAQAAKDHAEKMKDPLGYGRYTTAGPARQQRPSLLRKQRGRY
jgi:hypothetical protein